MKRRIFRSVVLVTAPILVLLAACGPKPDAGEDAALPERPVRTELVATGDLLRQVEVIGELQGEDEVRVFAQVPDRIQTLAVREGDEVQPGQLLAVIRSDLQSEAVNQAQAGLEAALANAEALQDQVERTRILVEAGSASRSQLDTLEAQLRAAQAQVRQVGAGLSQAAAQRSRTLVKSPIAGVVSQINLREGDLAAPSIPILTVVKSSALKAVLRVPERDFLKVAPGMPVRLSPLARPEVVVEAQVSLRGPVVDRMTRTGLVEVHVPNPDGRLLAGTAVRAHIETDRRSGAVLVPASAVQLTPQTESTGEAVAFVADGEVARRRLVRIGERQGDRFEIVEGLSAGERLVTLGASLLRDGNPIRDMAARDEGKAGEAEAPAEGAAQAG